MRETQAPHPLNRMIMKYWCGPARHVDRHLNEGDEVAGFKVLDVPGHSPGHIAYWRESDRVLILGDVLNNMDVITGLPGLRDPKPFFTTDPALNRRSAQQARAARAQARHVRPRRAAARHAQVRRLRERAPRVAAGRLGGRCPPTATRRSRSAPATSPPTWSRACSPAGRTRSIFHPEPEGDTGGELLDRRAAPERDRRAAHGPRAQRVDPGPLHPARAHARQAGQVDLRHRPRRHRGAAPGREGARGGGHHQGGARPRGVRRAGLGAGAASYGSTITEQFKRLGASLDYEDERFTMDDDYQRAVAIVFVHLYEKGLVYRDNYMVNWDPGLRTAISDLEVEQRTVEDTLYSIDYPLESGSGSITVATVRPETMLADTAIAVNPDDERYSRLIGETAMLPLVGRRLPVIADEHVDPEFGTGALKITPGHDPADFEIGRRHGLEEVSVIGEDGRITDAAPERFRGHGGRRGAGGGGGRAARRGARLRHRGLRPRRAALAPLGPAHRAADLAPVVLRHERPRAARHRGGARRPAPLPPRASADQKVYLDWLENIRPWCLSRQLWWGHQLPVWYRGEETYVGVEPPEGDGWERDPDVLDTWFSSGLWPFATLGWPEETPELRAFYPTDLNSTARDIIFLWVARMVMFGIELTGEVPFSDVNIHSVIQAPDGRRMSKSLGTGMDPLELIDGARRRRPALRPAGDVLGAGRQVQRGARQAGPRPGQQALERVAADPAAGVRGGARRARGHRGGGPLDRLAAGAPDRAGDRAVRRVPLLARRARPLRRVLVGAVRLVPRAGQAAPVRGGQRGGVGRAAVGARAHAAPAPPGDAVRDRGDLVADARASAGCSPSPTGRPPTSRCIDDAAEAERRAPDRGGHRPAPLPRGGRRQAVGDRCAGGSPPTATTGCASTWPGWRASSSWARTPPTATCWPPCRCPAAACRCCPRTPSTRPRPSAAAPPAASSSTAEIERAERKLANEQFVERAPAEVVDEERRKLEEYREALRRLGTE